MDLNHIQYLKPAVGNQPALVSLTVLCRGASYLAMSGFVFVCVFARLEE
jgi:hypothetical protein